MAIEEKTQRGTYELLSGTYSAAAGAMLSRAQVVAAYPITPQTTVVERLAEYIAKGELAAKFIPVESEHSAMSVLASASQNTQLCLFWLLPRLVVRVPLPLRRGRA